MRKIQYITLLLGLFVGVQALAQKKEIDLFSIPLSSPNKPGKLEVEQIAGSIKVVAYEGKEVIVKVTVKDHNDNCGSCNERKGMKRISANSNISISAEEKDNVVQIHNEMWSSTTNFDIKVPKNFSLRLKTINEGDIYVENINGVIEASNINGDITLVDVAGAASADTNNGKVKVSFTKLDTATDMAFSSFNGDVEVVFPSSLKANVKAKSDMGDIFTDFDMVVAKNTPEVEKRTKSGSYRVKIEQWVRGEINGGGPEMLFKTYTGDILIKSR